MEEQPPIIGAYRVYQSRDEKAKEGGLFIQMHGKHLLDAERFSMDANYRKTCKEFLKELKDHPIIELYSSKPRRFLDLENRLITEFIEIPSLYMDILQG